MTRLLIDSESCLFMFTPWLSRVDSSFYSEPFNNRSRKSTLGSSQFEPPCLVCLKAIFRFYVVIMVILFRFYYQVQNFSEKHNKNLRTLVHIGHFPYPRAYFFEEGFSQNRNNFNFWVLDPHLLRSSKSRWGRKVVEDETGADNVCSKS